MSRRIGLVLGGRGQIAAMAESSSKTTTDHDEIRKWVEAHGGKPAAVKRTGEKDDPGVLRIDMPGGAGGESLEEIFWDEWYEKLEENNLVFL